MGDHRPKITCDFEMHGHKAHFDFGWRNWSDNGNGIDQRIVDWFREQSGIAMDRWRASVNDYIAEQSKADTERRERAEFARLKEKYDTTTNCFRKTFGEPS